MTTASRHDPRRLAELIEAAARQAGWNPDPAEPPSTDDSGIASRTWSAPQDGACLQAAAAADRDLVATGPCCALALTGTRRDGRAWAVTGRTLISVLPILLVGAARSEGTAAPDPAALLGEHGFWYEPWPNPSTPGATYQEHWGQWEAPDPPTVLTELVWTAPARGPGDPAAGFDLCHDVELVLHTSLDTPAHLVTAAVRALLRPARTP